MSVEIPKCKQFTGYKPCHPGKQGETCISPEPIGTRILIINIAALGAVLMTTTVLPALKRKYPVSTIHWLTGPRAAPLLQENPYIDKIHTTDAPALLTLQAMRFDVVCNTDKIQDMCALTNVINADVKLGFGLNEDGVIIPLNKGSEYNYRMGIDNNLKFKENTRTYPDILRETCDLDREIDPYVFHFTDNEKENIAKYRESIELNSEVPVLGINTGSSTLFPNKRPPERELRKLISALYERNGGQKIVLLGGLEDTERNDALMQDFHGMVINTPTTEGLRNGLCYVDVCDYVFTGDSFGMHMAIGLGKNVIVWFNVSCSPEIELYGRGEKIQSAAYCSPCLKQVCDIDLRCLEEDISGEMLRAYDRLLKKNI